MSKPITWLDFEQRFRDLEREGASLRFRCSWKEADTGYVNWDLIDESNPRLSERFLGTAALAGAYLVKAVGNVYLPERVRNSATAERTWLAALLEMTRKTDEANHEPTDIVSDSKQYAIISDPIAASINLALRLQSFSPEEAFRATPSGLIPASYSSSVTRQNKEVRRNVKSTNLRAPVSMKKGLEAWLERQAHTNGRKWFLLGFFLTMILAVLSVLRT